MSKKSYSKNEHLNPDTRCPTCDGRGEVYSHTIFLSSVYKTCKFCKGTGTKKLLCLECGKQLWNAQWACVNNECPRYALKCVLAD